MGVPSNDDDREELGLILPTPDVRDFEVDDKNERISWTEGCPAGRHT